MKNEVANGVCESLYRSRKQIAESKLQKKDWANTWFLKGDVKATVSCQVTPGGILKSKLSQMVNKDRFDGKVQVIEDGGKPIYCGLRVNDLIGKPSKTKCTMQLAFRPIS